MGWRGQFWSGIPDFIKPIALIGLAVAIGAIAWSGEPRLLPLAVLFPGLWALASSRPSAGFVAAGYFLSGSRGLPQGVSEFFDIGVEAGIVLWIGASLVFVTTHALLWSARPGLTRAFRYAVIATVLSVPPLGIVGWGHPITAAGILFPGGKWLGLAAMAILVLSMTSSFRPIGMLVLGALWAGILLSWNDPRPLDGWMGINTEFGGSPFRYERHLISARMVRQAADRGTDVVVLPEGALGVWTATAERLWVEALEDARVTAYGGAVLVTATGYDNVMLELSGQGARVLYRQRMPVPISMWQPWTNLYGAPAGASADFFANPIVTIAGRRVATLVCYEQLLVWPVLQSALFGSDILVATANGWWTSGTGILKIQAASTKAWSRLFDLPTVMASNT